MRSVVPAFLLVCLASACGPSAAEVRRAKSVLYHTDFVNVWNAVVDEVHRRYPQVETEDPINGFVRTSWRLIERSGGDFANTKNGSSQSTGSTPPGTPTNPNGQVGTQQSMAGGIPGSVMMRVWVNVKGPPWRVSVDGEAAEYKPNMTMLVPFRHGVSDEPTWVPVRIDNLTVAIYERLRAYARDDVAPPKPVVVTSTDESPWADLPDRDAAALIAKVRGAAKARDVALLRPLMDPAFVWSAGGAPSADVAVAMWGADPGLFATLTKVLDGGCGHLAVGGEAAVTCPAGAPLDPLAPGASGARAVFRKLGGVWRFVAFVIS